MLGTDDRKWIIYCKWGTNCMVVYKKSVVLLVTKDGSRGVINYKINSAAYFSMKVERP